MSKKKKKIKPEDYKFELILTKVVDTKERKPNGKPIKTEVIDRSRKFRNGYDMWKWATNFRNWEYEE